MLISASARLEGSELFAKNGYDAIDASFCAVILEDERHNPILDGDDWKEKVKREKEKCDKLGIKVQSIHMPYKYQFTEEKFPWKYEMMCRSLIAAEILGAEWAVMHMKPVEYMVPMLKKMYAETQVKNVGIAFEKSGNKRAEDLVILHDAVEAAGIPVGYCLDVGHFHINKYYEYDVVEWIYKFGSRIKVLHMHDNFRTGDNHTIPFNGNMPWEKIMRALKDVGYEGNFNYEIAFYGTPEALKPVSVRYWKEIAEYLIKIFDEHVPNKEEMQI